MKINWNENPLKSTIEVDQSDRERILLYIQNEYYLDLLCHLDLWLHGDIQNDDEPTIEKIQEQISTWARVCNIGTDDQEVEEYVEDLQSQHAGDCTCLPIGCMKCRAEEALGFSTIAGLGEHSARKIQALFERYETINEVLEELRKPYSYERPENWPKSIDYEKHIPRWEAERVHAAEWLTQYKRLHGF